MKTLRDWLLVFTAVLAAGAVLLYAEHRARMWEKEAEQVALDLTRLVADAERFALDATASESARKLFATQVIVATNKLQRAKDLAGRTVMLSDNRALTETISRAARRLDNVKEFYEGQRTE